MALKGSCFDKVLATITLIFPMKCWRNTEKFSKLLYHRKWEILVNYYISRGIPTNQKQVGPQRRNVRPNRKAVDFPSHPLYMLLQGLRWPGEKPLATLRKLQLWNCRMQLWKSHQPLTSISTFLHTSTQGKQLSAVWGKMDRKWFYCILGHEASEGYSFLCTVLVMEELQTVLIYSGINCLVK